MDQIRRTVSFPISGMRTIKPCIPLGMQYLLREIKKSEKYTMLGYINFIPSFETNPRSLSRREFTRIGPMVFISLGRIRKKPLSALEKCYKFIGEYKQYLNQNYLASYVFHYTSFLRANNFDMKLLHAKSGFKEGCLFPSIDELSVFLRNEMQQSTDWMMTSTMNDSKIAFVRKNKGKIQFKYKEIHKATLFTTVVSFQLTHLASMPGFQVYDSV